MIELFKPLGHDPLELVEGSLEEPIPLELEAQADPLCRMLDLLEHSIENQLILDPTIQDPLWDVLDRLEKATEGQVIPKNTTNLTSLYDVSEPTFSAWSNSYSQLPDLGYEQRPLTREYQLPRHKMRKGASGLRNNASSICYCLLREMLVSIDECESCPDFKDNGTGGLCESAS